MDWFDNLKRAYRKRYLANALRLRGVCPSHGTKIILDRSEGIVGHGGVVAGERVCLQCEEEAKARKEELEAIYDLQTEAMLEEYKRLSSSG